MDDLTTEELVKKANNYVSNHWDKDVIGSQIMAELCHRLCDCSTKPPEIKKASEDAILVSH